LINDSISIDGVALVYAIVPLSILLFQNLQVYRSMRKFSGWSSVNKNTAVFKLGLSFFLIQIAVLILNSTDNLMINAWFGASAVTDYYVTMRLTGYLLLFWSIISNMFWTEFGLLYNECKLSVLKNRVVILVKVSLVFTATVAFFILTFMEDILLVWIGDDITVSHIFKAAIILFIALHSVNSIYLALINGIGATRIQLFSAVATILLNIPLSYLYSVELGMGPEGILLGTTTCLVYSFALRAWQVFNILRGSQRKLFYL
jgi:O-antigen/teichoic acid export membrane protein